MMSFLLLTVSVFAQAVPPVYSWEQCVDIAKRNNAEILSAEKVLSSNNYIEWNAKGYFLPELFYNLSANRGDTQVGGVLINTEINTRYQGSFTARQNLFNGFADYGRIKQTQANVRAAEASLRLIKAKISYDLKSSYQSLMYAKEYNRLTDDIIRRRRDNMDLVDLRYRSGRENRGSLLLAQAYSSQAEYDDLQAENTERNSRAELARTLGLDEFEPFDIQGQIPLAPAPKNVDIKELALQTPEHFQARAQWDAALANVTMSRSTFLPSLDLAATYGQTAFDFYPTAQENWQLGLTFSYRLFAGFRDLTALKSASALSSAAEQSYFNVNRQLVAKLTQAYSTYVEAVLRYEVDRRFKNATEVRAEIARKKYNNGLLTFEDWDVIESDLIERQKAFLRSQRDRTIAEAAWEQALGQGVIQ